LDKNKFGELWKCRVVARQVLAFLLVFLVVLSGLSVFLGLLSAQAGLGEGEISVDLAPLLDKYGQPAVNADGTFYPNDKFELSYNTKLAADVTFEKVEVSYDSSVFNMFDSSNFGSETGFCSFEVLASVSAGTYTFHFDAHGSRFSVAENATIPVVVEKVFTVQVVAYDPHFTVELVYTVPTGGGSSYTKPFALIIRYDGNGPNYNLNQRAIIDDYTWGGYAQKTPEIDQMQQTITPDLTVANFFNQTSNTQFLTQGIDTKTSQTILNVDGKSFLSSELPAGFFWEANTNHTYVWTQTLPVNGDTGEEWFEWQSCIVFPPSINPDLQINQELSQEDLQNQLIDQINSPNGTLTVTPFGNTITALYVHNKLVEKFAKDVGVSNDKVLECLTPSPLYFTAQTRYAKIQYLLNPTVAKEITKQGFTNAIWYNLTVGCDMFGEPRYFEANFTCPYEFFDKLINATAYKWNPTLQKWDIDNTVSIRATFESALNFTTTDILRSEFEAQTSDPVALRMALEDLYDSGAQIFTGTGAIEANLKRTSPLYYNLVVEAGRTQKTLVHQTVELSFRDDKPYTLPLNFDSSSPLQVSVIADNSQNALLQLDAPTELGGLSNVSVYLITNGAAGKDFKELSKDQLELRLLKTLNLTLTQESIPPSGYEQNYQQFYQYYTGSSSISDGLGFCGQTQVVAPKDKAVTALLGQGEVLLYVEATNVWGTTFHQIVSVQPYSAPKWEIPINEATIYLVAIVIIAIVTSFIIYMIRTKQ